MSIHSYNTWSSLPLRTWTGIWLNRLACCIGIALFAGVSGCGEVRPYQRVYLNDYNMRLGKADIEKFDESVHTYREGASGGGNGKASGGCGCN